MRQRKTRNRASGDDGEGLSLPDTSYNAEPEVTAGLVPTGIPGIYQSPAEPVDPYDCDRWPDSPYCGGNITQGNPLDPQNLANLSVEVSINPCETCVTITPSLFHIGLPPYTICQRSNNPSCTPRVPRPPEPFPSNPRSFQNPRRNCKEGTYKIICEYIPLYEYIPNLNEWIISEIDAGTELGDALKIYQEWTEKINEAQIRARQFGDYVLSEILGVQESNFETLFGANIPCNLVFVSTDGSTSNLAFLRSPGFYYKNIITSYRFTSPQYGSYEDGISKKEFYLDYAYLDSILPQCQINLDGYTTPDPPSYPPPPRRNCCMSCCNSRDSEENNELLRLIARRLGVSDYPFTVPANLLANRSRSAKKLESNAQVWEWFIRQFDALAGEFPIEIEIEDADPTKQGDQAAKIKVDNISEALAELLGIGINTSINTESLVNIGIRTLSEAGMAKNAAIVAQDLGLANAEFLDYELKQITRTIPSTFTPGKTDLDDILKESNQKIRSYENVDDHQLKDYMTELLQGVAIIRAAFWRKLDPNKPYSGQIRSLLRNLVNLADNDLTKDKDGKPTQKSPTEDFDSFLEQVERGFTDEAGIQDSTKPYGRNPEARPRIRELGDQSEG